MFEQLLVPQANLIAAVLGLFCLVAGRKYFAVVAATTAFFIAASALSVRMDETTQDARTTVLLFSTLIAIAAGVFSRMSRPVAVGIAGYTIAGYILSLHASSWGFTAPGDVRLSFVLGGVLGSALIAFATEAGLIALSSLLGAHLIVQYFTLEDELRKWLVLALTVVGIFIQAGVFHQGGGGAREAPKK